MKCEWNSEGKCLETLQRIAMRNVRKNVRGNDARESLENSGNEKKLKFKFAMEVKKMKQL